MRFKTLCLIGLLITSLLVYVFFAERAFLASTLFTFKSKELVNYNDDDLFEPEKQLDGKMYGNFTRRSEIIDEDNHVCVIVRFFSKQLNNPIYNLEHLLKSFSLQTHKNWEMMLLSTDPGEIHPLGRILDQFGETDKVRVLRFDSMLRAYKSRQEKTFHHNVYKMTDRAIRHCTPGTKWLLVSNGDNLYDPTFLEHVTLVENQQYDILGTNFHSRWYNYFNHIGGRFPACYRFKIRDRKKEIEFINKENYGCIKNGFKYGGTDLGANILSYKRFITENRRYATIIDKNSDGSQDGLMIEKLVESGWKPHNFGKCLYDHNPNYHSCINRIHDTINMSMLHMWDDTKLECIIGEPSDDGTPIIPQSYQEYPGMDRCITQK